MLSPSILALSKALVPELLFTAGIILLLLLEFLGVLRRRSLAFGIAAALILSYPVLLYGTALSEERVFHDSLQRDSRALMFQLIFSVSTLLTLIMAYADPYLFRQRVSDELAPTADKGKGYGEFLFVLLSTLLALQVLGMAQQLILIFVALEMIAIGSYVLVHFRFRAAAAEASLKYLLFGMLSSGLMLYGISWLYGLSGELTIQGLSTLNYSPMAFLALVLFAAGLFFKLSAPPFHFWAPDVYEGSPTSVAAFLSVATKAAGLIILMRLYTLFSAWPFFQEFLIGIALLALIIGNTVALWQQGSKRMLAYSAVSHTGFLLIGVLAARTEVVLFYLWVYLLLNYGAFALVQVIETATRSEKLQAFSGYGRRKPALGVALVILMLGLTGLPPTAGLTVKFWLFAALWDQYGGDPLWLTLLIVGVLSSVVGLFYYLKMPYYAFFREAQPEKAESTASGWLTALISITSALVVVLLFYNRWLFG